MSNTAVGQVYDTIIAEVINAVRVDFEENGVDDGALEDLKKVRPLSQSPTPLCPCHCNEVHSAILPTLSHPPSIRRIHFANLDAARSSSMHHFFRAIDFSSWR
jgi:hypothetical protein